MQKNIEQIKSDIRAMLNLAKNDAAAEGEIENAMKFARRYMVMYNLTEEDVAVDPNHIDLSFIDELEIVEVECDIPDRQLATWESSLATVVSKTIGSVQVFLKHVAVKNKYGGFVYTANGKAKQETVPTFVGPMEEALLARELYESLCAKIAAMAFLKYGTVARGAGRSYGDGFVAGLYNQIKTVDAQLAVEHKSNALVVQSNIVATKKLEKADEYINKYVGKLRNGTQSKVNHYSGAYYDGVNDGKKADMSVHRTRKLGGSVALLT